MSWQVARTFTAAYVLGLKTSRDRSGPVITQTGIPDAGLRRLMLRVLPTLAFFAVLSFVASIPQARADLILTNSINITGTGLGAVNTLTTAQDNGPPAPGNDGIESGCVGRSGGGDIIGNAACLFGLAGGDEQASNQTVRVGDMVDANGDPTTLMNLGDIVLVFNLAETGMDVSVGLANLFVAIYDTTDTLVFSAELTAAQQSTILTQGTRTGTGGSGFTFIFDAAQYLAASVTPSRPTSVSAADFRPCGARPIGGPA